MDNTCQNCGARCTTFRKYKDIKKGLQYLCWKCFQKRAHIIYCCPRTFNEPLSEKVNATFFLTRNQKGRYTYRIKKLKIKKSEYHRNLVVSDIENVRR